MKRKLSLILGIMLMISMAPVYGADDMSFWAVDEVSGAIEEGLVPGDMQSDYQEDITRSEYVLLALEVLKHGNRDVLIEIKHPFFDIDDHVYEDEIIYAYNAGIIKGDGKGSFRPDDKITREEIASLVCHLVLALDGNADVMREQYISFDDREDIAFWALTYIEFCYQNGIMKGVGQREALDIMKPKGLATKEQAIILLYRLATTYELLTNHVLPNVEIISYDSYGNEMLVETDQINGFVKTAGVDTGKLLSYYSKLDEFRIKALEDNYFNLLHSGLGAISLYEDGSVVEISLSSKMAEETDIMKAFINFAELYTDTEQIEIAVARSYVMFKAGTMETFEQALNDNGSIEIEYNHISSRYVYKVVLDKRL